LSYVAVQGGAAPPSLSGPFSYLDLGCGFAHTTIVNAAAYPTSEFHACDFNPEHIAAARRRAARLGVDNVHFHEALFEEFLQRELPAFDFIVLHGVLSWITPGVYATVREIIARKLKPGGIVYLSYNCEPGWSAEAPLRRLMFELGAEEPGSAEQRASAALGALQQLSNPSFKYFRDVPSARDAVDSFAREPKNYLAHEFLNPAWTLYYSIDVAGDLARLGASFVGSATLAENHPMLLIDKQAADAITRLPSARLRQLALDFAANQRFRRDVFVKPAPPAPSPAQTVHNIDQLVVGCVGDVEQIGTDVTVPRGKLKFQEAFIADLRALMSRGSMTIGDIVGRLGGPGRGSSELRQNLLFLVAAGALMPFARAASYDEGEARQRAANRSVRSALEEAVATAAAAVVPCEHAGNGVMVGPHEARQALSWLAGNEPPAAHLARLKRLGLIGAPVADP
jgi:SAM-dependent methyltransferase